MEAKRISLFVYVSVLAVSSSNLSASKTTSDETKCQRGNDSLIPTNVTCINYNFRNINCTWLLGIEYGNTSKLDTSCHYEISSDESVQMQFAFYPSRGLQYDRKNNYMSWRPCPNQKPTSCSWNYTYDTASIWFSVVVAVRNRKLNTSTETTVDEISVLDIAKPAPVTNFTVAKTRHPGCCKILWNPEPLSERYTCNLTISATCIKRKARSFLMFSSQSYEKNYRRICDLQPDTLIFLSVRRRLVIKKVEVGYWSDSVTVSERLDIDVPYVAPNATDGLYEVSSVARNGFITIKLYFTPLDDCELHDDPAHVIYTVKTREKTVNTTHPNFVVEIDVPNSRVINITLEARNNAGRSNKTSFVTVFPEVLVPKPSKLNIEHRIEADFKITKATITPTDNSATFSYLFHSVVWCQGNATSCKEPLRWIVIKTNKTNLHKHPGTVYFRYGLITHGFNIKHGQVTSTGIHWIDSTIRAETDESGIGSAFKNVLLYTIPEVAVVLLITLATVFLIIRYRRKLRSTDSSLQGSYTSGTTTSSSSVDLYNSDNIETDELLTNRGKTAHKEYISSAQYNWTRCINQRSALSAARLLHDNILPRNEELQFISSTFGRSSDTLKHVCTKICETIKQKNGNDTKVWPACTISSDKIVFVVESMSTLSDTRVSDFEIHSVNCHNTLEKESEIVMSREQEILASNDTYDAEKFKQLKQCIAKNAKRLMDKHSNINVISPSVVKSVGYSTSGQHKLIETLCISIYVEKKVRDLMPLEEEPIPADIGGFPTDVLEGNFSFFGEGPNAYHKNVKMGCGIHAQVRNDNGDILGGTLGGFVQHGTYGLCCITCAHLILSQAELQKAKICGFIEFDGNTGKRVYQPVSEDSDEFGRLIAASYKEGLDGSPGVEVALIKVLNRHPSSGSFPLADEGSDPNTAFEFNSGNVNDATLLRPMTQVYKFGMATGPTVGKLGLSGSAVRGGNNHVDDPNFGIRLYNQLEIYPEVNSSFAAIGDSGALVFIGHTRPSTAAAIGIVEGGLDNGKILVSPLFDILEALKCPSFLKRFEDSSDSGIQVNMPHGAECAEEDMDLS